MKDFWKESEEKKVNKKKIVITITTIILIILVIAAIITYVNNKEARDWIDKNILQKEKTQNTLPSIEIEENNNSNICAFNKYIGILNKNNFEIYDSTAKKENTLDIEISKPIFNSNNRYLVVAEEKGQRLYLIADKDIVWERSVEGNISQVTVNKNGYVAVTIVDTINKTVVAMYDNQGEHIFDVFLSFTRAVSTSISEDNKYLAIAEVDTSGTAVQSNIKVVSIEKAKSKDNTENSMENVYDKNNNDLTINIKYQEKGKLLCMYTDKIVSIKNDGTIEELQEYGDKKISFASIDLANTSITVEEKTSGIFTADSIINIINSDNKSAVLHKTESVTKEIYTSNNIIALNLGSEVEFINTNGWLIKRYIAEQEITNIVLADSVAGIIYRDKIEIINL